MASVNLVKPKKGGTYWGVRFRHQGGYKYISGFTTEKKTRGFAVRIQMLVDAYYNASAPPAELNSWISRLSDGHTDRLVELGLLDTSRVQANKPISEHIGEYEAAVRSRRGNTEGHAKAMARSVRKVCEGLKIKTFAQVRENDLLTWLDEQGIQPATARHRIIAMQDFAKWMVRDKRAAHNPIEHAPKPRPVPEWDRRPFTMAEMRKLLAFLRDHDRYEDQGNRSLWNGYDRYMLYSTAVGTGYRRSELAAIRRCDLRFSGGTPYIDLPARSTKNREEASVEIPEDLAGELAYYTQDLDLSDRVFWIPKGDGAVDMLHRDMREAGLGKLLDIEGQRIDFHAFRATAIVWWFEVDGLTALEVQRQARFKTLAMVQKYTRGRRYTGSRLIRRGAILKNTKQETA